MKSLSPGVWIALVGFAALASLNWQSRAPGQPVPGVDPPVRLAGLEKRLDSLTKRVASTEANFQALKSKIEVATHVRILQWNSPFHKQLEWVLGKLFHNSPFRFHCEGEIGVIIIKGDEKVQVACDLLATLIHSRPSR